MEGPRHEQAGRRADRERGGEAGATLKALAHVVARSLMGATDPVKAAPGTIRGDFGLVIDANVVHGSDSTASAERELSLFFPDLPLAED